MLSNSDGCDSAPLAINIGENISFPSGKELPLSAEGSPSFLRLFLSRLLPLHFVQPDVTGGTLPEKVIFELADGDRTLRDPGGKQGKTIPTTVREHRSSLDDASDVNLQNHQVSAFSFPINITPFVKLKHLLNGHTGISALQES